MLTISTLSVNGWLHQWAFSLSWLQTSYNTSANTEINIIYKSRNNNAPYQNLLFTPSQGKSFLNIKYFVN